MAKMFTTARVRGKPFPKGQPKDPRSGRKPGGRNFHSREVRAVILEAAHQIGGVARLVEWVKESDAHETIFWQSIWARLAPYVVIGSGPHGEIELKLSSEDFMRKLAERGLPTSVFGADKPVIEVAPIKRIESGNGGGDGSGSDIH